MRDKKKEPKPKKEWPLGTDEKREEEKDLPPQMRSVPYIGMSSSSAPGSLGRDSGTVLPGVNIRGTGSNAESSVKLQNAGRAATSPTEDTFRERKCPLNSDSHSEHDKALLFQEEEVRKLSLKMTELERQLDDAETAVDLRFHNEEEKLKSRIKELEASQVVIPEGEKDRTNQVLAQRVYELQKQNAFLRQKLSGKRKEAEV